MEPEDWFALGDVLPYDVTVTYAASGKLDCFDVRFARCDRKGSAAISHSVTNAVTREDFVRFTNNPLREILAGQLVPELRKLAQEKLPDYMIPAAFCFAGSAASDP